MEDAADRLRAAPNLNHLWAGLLIEELVRQGVGLFIVAPGSRSTPLAMAVALNERAESIVHWDERGGAFVALGWARASGRPAALITTSGTALANAMPAAVEADAEGVPLLLLTADRPPELRETGANQTIRQPGFFDQVARWSFDLPTPSAEIEAAFVLTTAAQAVHRSLSPPGPVHLNLPFREPLAPVPEPAPARRQVGEANAEGIDAAALLSGLRAWGATERPFTRYVRPGRVRSQDVLETLMGIGVIGEPRQANGLVVLGKTEQPRDAEAAECLAAALGWPLVADVASGARLGPAHATLVPYADLVLASEAFRRAAPVGTVIHLGGRSTSKRLAQFLAERSPRHFLVVRPDAERFDPSHQVTARVQADIADFCGAALDVLPSSARRGAWYQRWRDASEAAGRALDAAFAASEALSEPRVARLLSEHTPDGHGLVAASSMPIRDLDAFAASGHAPLRVTANRGASGIDGLVATAAGFARGLNRSTTLLIGDLALLYDLNSLALLRESLPRTQSQGAPVTVVVLNNDGGGIFHFLPVEAHAAESAFERYFGTPHGLGFEAAAQMFGLAYAQPETVEAFAAAYRGAMARETSTIIEVRTDREANVALHRALTSRVVEEVERALGL
ncbi:MAG: 2-succinyl-5-enolpyruvyl-6-hydroxy-3-cyclohexene-1-carboxylic-acid synthase [Rhodothermaceae bacterium]|nr:2-succinyl-5-enolpyruvyl-6-hydroxy-3-cyclohexene-1-carboxylic-acid synthase [Rhodothermaceae bacterium]